MTSTVIDVTDIYNSSVTGPVFDLSLYDYFVIQVDKTTAAGINIQATNDAGETRTYTPSTTSPGAFPGTGGSGPSGQILAGDYFLISSNGYLGTQFVYEGQSIQAKLDNPSGVSDWKLYSIREFNEALFAVNFQPIGATALLDNLYLTAIYGSGNYRIENPCGKFVKLLNDQEPTVNKMVIYAAKIV